MWHRHTYKNPGEPVHKRTTRSPINRTRNFQLLSTVTEQTRTTVAARCSLCQHPVSIRLKICRPPPPLLAFEFSAQPTISIDHSLNMQLESCVQKYSLASVIYYSHSQFTTQIITRDLRIWFYDGMLITYPTVEPTLECAGSINDPSFSMVCRGGTPCGALYYCLW